MLCQHLLITPSYLDCLKTKANCDRLQKDFRTGTLGKNLGDEVQCNKCKVKRLRENNPNFEYKLMTPVVAVTTEK